MKREEPIQHSIDCATQALNTSSEAVAGVAS